MRFCDFYTGGSFCYSIEVYPPKTETGVQGLLNELAKLKEIAPAYVSVTYGAMGTTRTLTRDLALNIHQKLGLTTAFHFTCVGSTPGEIKTYVQNLRRHGIDLIVALRGDYPKDQTGYRPPQNGFRYANELVSYLKGLDNFSIAVAGYPETHVEAVSPKDDLKNLKRKVDAGAEVVITQLFFDNGDFYEWLEKARQQGITVPVIPGIMPILKLDQIQRITKMCGAKIPGRLLKKLQSCQGDTDAMREAGVEHAIGQCRDLIQNGVPGIHFYCLNRAHSVLRIVKTCENLVSQSIVKSAHQSGRTYGS